MRRLIVYLLPLTLFLSSINVQSQPSERPFILPVQGEPGPTTWLFGQAYGNTTGAFNFGDLWYAAGQGLHFGLDFPMPCGTPLVAVGHGVVVGVDDLSRGAGPHNLLIRHDEQQVVTLYGHLLQPAPLSVGQIVRQGDVVGQSGDPDITCDSRPHLHFEVRTLDYRTALNPVAYIDANWHTIASVGGYGFPLFQQDMDNPRRWMTLEDQPTTQFGGARLNSYAAAWPLPFDLRPPSNANVSRNLEPLNEHAAWMLRQIGFDQCCWSYWWHPTDADTFYVVDGSPGQRAGVFQWSASSGRSVGLLHAAPPIVTSPDGRYQIFNNSGAARIVDTESGEEWTTPPLGSTPAINPDNTRIMWVTSGGVIVPGQARPISTVWVANLDGYGARQIVSESGLSAQWLDSNRLLLSRRGGGEDTTLSVYQIGDDTSYELGTFLRLRGLQVSPGGDYLSFMLLWQDNPEDSGIYITKTEPNTQPRKVDWFGSWRWRDNSSLYYLPLDVTSPYHTLVYYDVQADESRTLVTPDDLLFTVMNGDWDISADGNRIVFHNALDSNMWLLEVERD